MNWKIDFPLVSKCGHQESMVDNIIIVCEYLPSKFEGLIRSLAIQ